MIMRVLVPVITALVLIVVGVFFMFMWLVGTNGYDSSTGGTILVAQLVLIVVTIVLASVASGLLAHVLQKRSGISPWLVGPLTVVAVTAVAIVTLFLVGTIIVAVIDSTRRRPAPPPPPPAANRRGGGR